MEGNPSPVRGKSGTHRAKRSGRTGKNHRQYPVDDDDDFPGDLIKCSGKNCQTCTAELIADCVAVCCCPCAVLNILVLGFVKFPWMMGKRCLRLGRKKVQRLEKKRKCERSCYSDIGVVDSDGILRKGRVEEGTLMEIESSGCDDFSARFEAEKVWLEWYQQVGDHLGFGRLSSTGISPQGEGN